MGFYSTIFLRSPSIRIIGILVLLGVIVGPVCAQDSSDPPGSLEHIGVVEHQPVNEISGIAKSSTYDNVYWVHNDSGGGARLFAIDSSGQVIIPDFMTDRFRVGRESVIDGPPLWPGTQILLSENVDWEDIALADGYLFIGDMGNNSNARRDLGVYVVEEPNPRAVPSTRSLRFLPVEYPEQEFFPGRRWHFDSEALFVFEEKLYFLTKHRVTGEMATAKAGTNLYRLDSNYTDRKNVLTLVGSRTDIIWPTAASLSPDGNLLAILTPDALWLFSRPPVGDDWLSGKLRQFPLPRDRTKQVEAVCWDDSKTLRIANEQRDLFSFDLTMVHSSLRGDSKP